ncbi:hypothetical protein V1477_004700 [Vespula maculifrons]|uniref:Uncharacterized protein n=1 Tax=Vespula maculifrons TaxID=7453 RepID=A0ABD2CMJ7_VESMC
MIPRGRTIGDSGGDQARDQEDDAAAEQEPGTAGEAGWKSQGGGKCAHRPRGASQPPKPSTAGASTSFPFARPLPHFFLFLFLFLLLLRATLALYPETGTLFLLFLGNKTRPERRRYHAAPAASTL